MFFLTRDNISSLIFHPNACFDAIKGSVIITVGGNLTLVNEWLQDDSFPPIISSMGYVQRTYDVSNAVPYGNQSLFIELQYRIFYPGMMAPTITWCHYSVPFLQKFQNEGNG